MEENNLIAVESLDSFDAEHNVFTEPTHPIPAFKHAMMSLGTSLLGLVKWLLGLLWSMVQSLGYFTMMAGVYTWSLIKGIYNFFKRKCHQFKYNDLSGRLSYIVFGASSFKNKRYVFGALYLIFQTVYLVLLLTSGVNAVSMLKTLGSTGASDEDPDADFSQLVVGDNSIMIMIFGLLWLVSLIIFIYVWNRSINNGYYNYRVNKLLKFEGTYKDHLEFGHELDAHAEASFKEGLSLAQAYKLKKADVDAYLANIEDTKDRAYAKYLIKNTYSHKYAYLKKLEKQNKKLAKLEAKRDSVKATREESLAQLKGRLNAKLEVEVKNGTAEPVLEEIREKNKITAEVYKNKTTSLVNECNLKCRSKRHQIEELSKRFSPFIEMQLINNNKKYSKENNYYKHVAKLDSEITFYSHFDKFARIYNNGLLKADEKNQENAQTAIDLLDEYNRKVEKTKAKFSGIRARKADLQAELKQADLDYKLTVAEIKKNGSADENALLTAKAKLIDATTVLMRKINDLPTDKNINALEKEELKESKRAYIRDKKYLKTNYTGVTLAFEEVVNEMVVEYKIDYTLAVSYAKSMFKKEDGKERMLTSEEASLILEDIRNVKNEYLEAHQDKYDVKFESFLDVVKSLFNNKFHITILFLPILGIVLFSIIPLIFSIFIAFTNYSKGHEPPTQLFTWIGFDNFKTIFNPDPNTQFAMLPSALSKTLGWTLTWAIVATFSNYILGIIVALMINKEGIKFKKLWRTVFVMTIAIPQFISLLSIGTLLKDSGALGHWYNDTFGSRLGFGTDGNAVFATKLIIILVNIWVGIPYTILSTTGILLNIPKDLYESAKVDGSSTFTQFTKITMPYILFVTGPYLITQFIGNINNFNVIFFLTGGGPALAGSGLLGLGETDLLITFIYKVVTSTSNPQYGIASAIGIIVFIICSFISIVMYSKSGSIKEEDQFQ